MLSRLEEEGFSVARGGKGRQFPSESPRVLAEPVLIHSNEAIVLGVVSIVVADGTLELGLHCRTPPDPGLLTFGKASTLVAAECGVP